MGLESTINLSLIVNDETIDGNTQLAPGQEAVDGDGYAVITLIRSEMAPQPTDVRPAGQLWLKIATKDLWWSRGGGLWYQVRNTQTLPSHEETHEPQGSDALPWSTIHGHGVLAARPLASAMNQGYLYDATDVQKLYLSDGSAWQEMGVSQQAAEYIHVQGAPISTWTVQHNLNRYPKAVAVRNSGGRVIGGGITHINLNQLTISFAFPFSGTATVG